MWVFHMIDQRALRLYYQLSKSYYCDRKAEMTGWLCLMESEAKTEQSSQHKAALMVQIREAYGRVFIPILPITSCIPA
jgi:hypothetical protein